MTSLLVSTNWCVLHQRTALSKATAINLMFFRCNLFFAKSNFNIYLRLLVRHFYNISCLINLNTLKLLQIIQIDGVTDNQF